MIFKTYVFFSYILYNIIIFLFNNIFYSLVGETFKLQVYRGRLANFGISGKRRKNRQERTFKRTCVYHRAKLK